MTPRRALVCAPLLALAVACASGCSGVDYKTRGHVKGTVTTTVPDPANKGKTKRVPLTTGTVMFYGPNGITASAQVNLKGEYTMPDAPIGDCQVTVTVSALPMDPTVKARLTGKGSGPKMPEMKNPEGQSPELPTAPEVPKEVIRIDEKYAKPESSGLKFTVMKGETHVFPIDL
jgi:hypothetical protein